MGACGSTTASVSTAPMLSKSRSTTPTSSVDSEDGGIADRVQAARDSLKYLMTKPAMEDSTCLRNYFLESEVTVGLQRMLSEDKKASVVLSTVTMNPHLQQRGYVPYGIFRDVCDKAYGFLPGNASTSLFPLEFLLRPVKPEQIDSIFRKGTTTNQELYVTLFTRSMQTVLDHTGAGYHPAVVYLSIVNRVEMLRSQCTPLYALPVAVAYFTDLEEIPKPQLLQ